MYDVSSGEILINGINIKEYDIHKLRMRIGTAFQNERILAMTLRENLSIYHNVSDDKLIEVIKKIGLERIYKNSNGLDTPISREFEEDGLVLSGGEVQRLAIARLFTGSFGLLMFTKEAQAEALTKAKNTAIAIISPAAAEFINEVYGDLETYLTAKIEEAVRVQKAESPVLLSVPTATIETSSD